MERGYSTCMKRSSAGAKSRAPPHARHAFVFSTTALISSKDKSTGHKTSIRSAVPAEEVIAREDVFGIMKPAAEIMGTTRRVVLSPGTPPMLCLSRMGPLAKSKVCPVSTIALDKASASSMLVPRM